MFNKRYLFVSAGDPSGIGYEIILKILPKIKGIIPIVFSPRFILKNYIKRNNFGYEPLFISSEILLDIFDLTYPRTSFLCVDVPVRRFGIKDPDARNGFYSIETLNFALSTIRSFISKKINVSLLTMPVSKNNISKFLKRDFFGHTEYIAKKFGIKDFSMLMVGKNSPNNYYVLLLTRHIPMKDVSKNLKVEKIFSQINNTVKFMESKLKINNTEILICGFNPHLGEKGKIGKEEVTVLKRAVNILTKSLKNNKIIFPILTEQAFKYAKNKSNVLIVALYHDQAMVPLKLLCGNNIANITTGLPFIRISPGHGTAFDIAGKNIADINPTMFCIDLVKNFLG